MKKVKDIGIFDRLFLTTFFSGDAGKGISIADMRKINKILDKVEIKEELAKKIELKTDEKQIKWNVFEKNEDGSIKIVDGKPVVLEGVLIDLLLEDSLYDFIQESFKKKSEAKGWDFDNNILSMLDKFDNKEEC